MAWRGKTVLITGASSGIGRAMAVELAARGARVGVLARRPELLQKLADEIRATGGTIEAEPCDVADRSAVADAIGKLEARLGPTDCLIANAGVSLPSGGDPVGADGVETMIRINYLGVVFGFEAVLPGMLARGAGHVVAVSSLAAYKGLPGAFLETYTLDGKGRAPNEGDIFKNPGLANSLRLIGEKVVPRLHQLGAAAQRAA